MPEPLAWILLVSGAALMVAGIVRRVAKREPGQSLAEAIWAPSHFQIAYTIGLVMFFIGGVALAK
jgi:hypothetical protein